MRGKCNNEGATGILGLLEEAAFDNYYDRFLFDAELLLDAGKVNSVKDAFVDRFCADVEPHDDIQHAFSMSHSVEDLKRSLQETDRRCSKANFNEEANFGLLWKAVATTKRRGY